MRLSQRLALKVAELRAKANAAIEAVNGAEEPTDEQQTAMRDATAALTAAESRHADALAAEQAMDRTAGEQFAPAGEQDSEARERAALVERANLGAIFAAAVENRHTEGAEAEVQAAFGIGSNAVPLDMLRLPVESRAVTPGLASGSVAQSQGAILPPVFASGDASFLGVAMPTVPAGTATYPVLTTRPTVGGPHTDSTAVAETTGAFSAVQLEPSRLQASFFWRRVDAARFRGMADSLRAALSAGLSEAMDSKIVGQIITDTTKVAASGSADSFASYRKRFVYDRLDGRHASAEGELRIVAGASTVAHMSGLYRGNTADDSAIDSIRRIAGGVRVSAHIPAVASNKQLALVRVGSRTGEAVAPTWEGVTLIRDEVTKAGTGEIALTAVMLAAWKVVRASGFAQVETQHA